LTVRFRDLLGTGGAQIAIQALAFLAGIAVVRFLPPLEYAAYTVTNTVLGSLVVIVDSGLAAGVLATGGRVWQDRRQLGTVVATALRLRRRMIPAAIIVTLVAVIVVVTRLGMTPWAALLLACASLPLLVSTSRTQILEAVPKLNQELRTVQTLQAGSNGARLVLLVMLLPAFGSAALAVAAAAVPQFWQAWRLRSCVARHADLHAATDPAVARTLRAQVRRTLPTAIYFAVSGQLSIWLVSIFGAARQVAGVGALSRLIMLLVAVSSAFSLLVVPRFARLSAGGVAQLRRAFWGAQALLFALGAVVVGGVAMFRQPVLWVLGPAYSDLGVEALLMAINGLAWAMAGGTLNLATARGVVTPSWLLIPCSLAVELVAALLLPVGTVTGAIFLSLATAMIQWALHAGHFEYATRRHGFGGAPT